jgi:hypothetical protein
LQPLCYRYLVKLLVRLLQNEILIDLRLGACYSGSKE